MNFKDKLICIKKELQYYKDVPSILMERCIRNRLDKSLIAFDYEIEQELKYLKTIKDTTLIRRL